MKLTIKDFPQHKLDRRVLKGRAYESVEGVWVILASDIEEYMPPVTYREFLKWMSGQTVMMVGQEAGYYLGDVERFLDGKGVID